MTKVIDWQEVESGQWLEVTTGAMRCNYRPGDFYDLMPNLPPMEKPPWFVDIHVRGEWVWIGRWLEQQWAFREAIRHLVRFNLDPEPSAHERLELMLQWPQEIWPDEWLKEVRRE